jgi:hypothetical protein
LTQKTGKKVKADDAFERKLTGQSLPENQTPPFSRQTGFS